MACNWWPRKHLAFILAFVSLTCILALAAAGLAFSEPPFPVAEIGPNWQCSRLAFVFTVCNPVSPEARPLARAKEPCRRPRVPLI